MASDFRLGGIGLPGEHLKVAAGRGEFHSEFSRRLTFVRAGAPLEMDHTPLPPEEDEWTRRCV